MEESGKNKRKEPRKRLIYYLKVFDDESNELIGNLVDITLNGMMLISASPLPLNKAYKLKIILPHKIQDKEDFKIGAESLWSKNDINPVLFDSGLQFKDLNEQDKEIIEDLLRHVSFDN